MVQFRTDNIPIPLFRPIVWLVVAVWLAATVLAGVLGNRYGLFDRPSSADQSVIKQVLASQYAAVEALVVIALVIWMTRRRPTIDAAAIGIPRNEALYVLRIAAVYGFIAIMGGYVLGTGLGTHAFSFHLPGTLVGAHSHDLVTRTQAIAWSVYNLVAFVVVPFVYLRRFPSGRSFLRSNNFRADILLIGTVLIIESVVQIYALSDALLNLSARQVVLGAPLSFLIYLLGTGLPTMIFVQVIIVPRLMVVTGSFSTSVILGGVIYTLVHMPESWMEFSSPSQVILSTILLFFTYFFPGMVKAVLTLRTGNAWVHLWAYHTIAPHVIIDTPLIVAIFGIS